MRGGNPIGRLSAVFAAALAVAGCVSVDGDALAARNAVLSGNAAAAVRYGEELADSTYSANLGYVEAGRANLLAGNFPAAAAWFRKGVESAIDRKESQPKIKLGDVGNTAMAATVTDDRTRNYYLPPYELNLALEYSILSEALGGKREDALVDARLACYVQDSLAQTYGADLAAPADGADARAKTASAQLCKKQSDSLQAMMAASRNSWENPVLWWLTGVLFEADGDVEQAWQSYRKASACRADNAVFAAGVARAEQGARTPEKGRAKLVVLYEEGMVPLRESLKIPVPIYTGMSIDIPTYGGAAPHVPGKVAISGAEKLVAAAPAVDVRALAARDLNERLPGVITRNVTRAAVQAGVQTAVNSAGNEYAKLAVFAANAVVSAMRRADTRSWITLPDGQQVWEDGAMAPGSYQVGVSVNGRTVSVPVALAADETTLVWIADCGTVFKTGVTKL
ncbi:MAG: hypothetical protein ACI4RD_06040 [Kiritimatiellia bacterium]